MGGGPLGGGASGLPHNWCVGVPEQQLGEVGLLEHLSALVDHGTAAGEGGGQGGGGGGGGEWRQGGQGETQEGGEGEGEGSGVVRVVEEDGGVCGAGGGRGG